MRLLALPTTPGAYQTTFQSISNCGPGSVVICPRPSTSAFLTKFNAQGSGLVFSTYISKDATGELIQTAGSIALDPSGEAYLAGNPNLLLVSAGGDALLVSTEQRSMNIRALALDAAGNLYVAGTSTGRGNNPFPATPGAFQTSPQPAIPAFPGSGGTDSAGGGLGDAFVAKLKPDLSKILAATLLGGEKFDTAMRGIVMIVLLPILRTIL